MNVKHKPLKTRNGLAVLAHFRSGAGSHRETKVESNRQAVERELDEDGVDTFDSSCQDLTMNSEVTLYMKDIIDLFSTAGIDNEFKISGAGYLCRRTVGTSTWDVMGIPFDVKFVKDMIYTNDLGVKE